MRSGFVRASELYDVDSRTPIAHPAHQATDADVRHALEDREVCTDGGQPSSGTCRCDELEERVAELESIINRELGYNLGNLPLEPQTVDCDCGESFKVNVVNGLVCPECNRTHGTDTDRSPSDSEKSTRNGGGNR